MTTPPRSTRERSPCYERRSADPHCKSLGDAARIGKSLRRSSLQRASDDLVLAKIDDQNGVGDRGFGVVIIVQIALAGWSAHLTRR
jgi:hypothetical protein